MIDHWSSVVRPLLEALSPRVIVEVGVFRGETTEKLLELASERDCLVHGIDPMPSPLFDLESLRERHGERFVFHGETSIRALPCIRDADSVLIDGDHNWYTVYNELSTLERVAAEERRPFPLTLLHDVDWPYGRRDMYYAPDSIPSEYRHPFQKAGILPGVSELVDKGGINRKLNNAVVEGTPRNGVRTAIEDFLAESDAPLSFRSAIGFCGLGIIVDEAQIEQRLELRARIAELDSPDWLEQQCRRLEQSRLSVLARLQAATAAAQAKTRAVSAGADSRAD